VTETVRQMNPGDSILFDTESLADSTRRIMAKLGHKAAKRKMNDGWRVWMVE
jgi:hypothetical protein